MKDNTCKVCLFFFLVVAFFACSKKKTDQVPLANVVQGTFYIDLHEEGEIGAVNSININTPDFSSWRYGNLKITQIVKDGEEVKAGDTLIVFDPSEVQKAIVEAEGRLEISQAELEKLQAQHESEQEELKADYEVTQISQEISKIRFESAVYESEMKKKEIQLNLEKSDIALLKAKEQIENRTKIQREEIKQKQLSIKQDVDRLNEAYDILNKLYVTTPAQGIAIVAQNWNSRNKFQVGDQCWTNYALIKLPDLSSLKATVNINEVDIAKIKKGLEVEIKPDAFSDSVYTGNVISVANLAVNKESSSNIKVFPVEILLNKTNKNLLPGLTVSCRILIDKMEDVLYIPLEALHVEAGKNFVYKQTVGGYEKVEIGISEQNTDFVIVTEGLKVNDKVALINPFGTKEDPSEENEQKKI